MWALWEGSGYISLVLKGLIKPCFGKAVVLRLVPPYTKELAPKSILPSFPKLMIIMTQLHYCWPIQICWWNVSMCMIYKRYCLFLLNLKKQIFTKETKEQIAYWEVHTMKQSCSKLWFAHRAGRITASNFKAAAITNSCMPSQNLINH